MAVTDQPGMSPVTSPAVSPPETEEAYSCDCPGYRFLDVMRMCLRCLAAYCEGLEEAPISRLQREHEMRRVAIRLRALLDDLPILANVPLSAVIRSTESPVHVQR